MFLLSWSPYHVAPSAEGVVEESVDISQQRLLDRNNYIITMETAWITVIP